LEARERKGLPPAGLGAPRKTGYGVDNGNSILLNALGRFFHRIKKLARSVAKRR